jgi:hypothetical protein
LKKMEEMSEERGGEVKEGAMKEKEKKTNRR